jgi:hypothetical protein
MNISKRRGSLVEVNPWVPNPRRMSDSQWLLLIVVGMAFTGYLCLGGMGLAQQLKHPDYIPIPRFDWWWMWAFSK